MRMFSPGGLTFIYVSHQGLYESVGEEGSDFRLLQRQDVGVHGQSRYYAHGRVTIQVSGYPRCNAVAAADPDCPALRHQRTMGIAPLNVPCKSELPCATSMAVD